MYWLGISAVAEIPLNVLALDRSHGQRGYPLAATHEAHALVGGELHVHLEWGQFDRVGQARAHGVPVGAQLRGLADDAGVDVAHGPAVLPEEAADLLQQRDRVGVAPALIGVGEVQADVAETGGAQERVDHGVGEHVGVGVAGEAVFGLGHLHPTQHQTAALAEAVRVVPDARARAHPPVLPEGVIGSSPVSYTHLRAHETDSYLVCRLLLEKKKKKTTQNTITTM